MLNKDLGFKKEQLLVLRRADAIGREKIEVFKQEIKKYPGVINATNSTAVPGYPNNNSGFLVEGWGPDKTVGMHVNWIDYDYFDTYELNIKDESGRVFSKEFATDTAAAIINESAVRQFGLEKPLEIRFMQPVDTGKFNYLQVIGVVKTFITSHCMRTFIPMYFFINPNHGIGVVT